MKKFHILYKTTNNINNKYYYGIHSTNNLNDGYIGSGRLLKIAIKKYGKENFTCEILKFFDDRESASLAEKNIITEEMINDDNCYNLDFGGDNIISKHSQSTKNKYHQK